MRTVAPYDWEDEALDQWPGSEVVVVLDRVPGPSTVSMHFLHGTVVHAFWQGWVDAQGVGPLTEPVEVLVEWRNRAIPTIRAGIIDARQDAPAR